MNFLIAFGVTTVASFLLVPVALVFARVFGLYLVVEERRCVVFELFGKVRAVIDRPGLHCPWLFLGPFAAIVPLVGKRYVVDLRLDQMYLRSQGVNSEEGAQQWGYDVGSVYVRKVHFRDVGMIAQIEQKVVNRLRQVTAAIQQDGSNRVNIIRSAADRQAAIELAKAGAMRPRIVGSAIAQIARRPDVCEALFDVLEIQQLTWAEGLVVQVIPTGAELLAQLSAASAAGLPRPTR